MRKCPSCNRENIPDARLCRYCSSLLDAGLNADLDRMMQALAQGKSVSIPKKKSVSDRSSPPKSSVLIAPSTEAETVQIEQGLPMLDDEDVAMLEPDIDVSSLRISVEDIAREREAAKRRVLLEKLIVQANQMKRNIGRKSEFSWGSRPLGLFIDRCDTSDRIESLASLLSIPSFRLVKTAYPQFGVFAEKKEDLQLIRHRIIHEFGLRAEIVSRALLARQPTAQACLSLYGQGYRILDRSVWLGEGLDSLTEDIFCSPVLAVQGMVEELRFKEQSRSQIGRFGRRYKEKQRVRGGEHRVGVLDLHCKDVVLRIVEGYSDFSTFPGFEKGAQRKSFQNLCSLLSVWIPGIRVVSSKICRVQKEMAILGDVKKVTAWPQWETHSRACRILWGVDKE